MPNDEYEIDVVAIRGNECKLVECKGHHANYLEGVSELERHFENRCEAASDPYGWDITKRYNSVESIFVTSGQLDDEAQAYASTMRKSHGIVCTVYTRDELMGWLNNLGQDHLCEILDQYYLDAPPKQAIEF